MRVHVSTFSDPETDRYYGFTLHIEFCTGDLWLTPNGSSVPAGVLWYLSGDRFQNSP